MKTGESWDSWDRYISRAAHRFKRVAPYIELDDFRQEAKIALWETGSRPEQVIRRAIDRAMARLIDRETQQRGPFISQDAFYAMDFSKMPYLTERQREVLAFYYHGRLSPRQIAGNLDITEQAVRKARDTGARKIFRFWRG